MRIITSGLFEAYRKCPIKCYRLSKGESGKGNSECGGNEAALDKQRRVAAQESAVGPAQSTRNGNG
jgi:hypothetical protein